MEKNTSDSLQEALKSASFGDKMWLFFTENLPIFIKIGVGILVVMILLTAIAIGKSIAHRSMEREFNDALISGDIEKFVKKYENEKLSGILFLELGDKAYKDQDFTKASKYYKLAANAFDDDIFEGKAMLSEGIALSRNENFSEAEKIFEKISNENKYLHFIRGEAMWLLGMNFWQQQELRKSKDIFNKLVNGNFSSIWQKKAEKILLSL